jgi:hypothetical protein
MPQREKWALAFDVGGLRYGVMTTNSSESFNKVFKGIRAVPVSGIVEYSFRKCNEYFVNQWNIAKVSNNKLQLLYFSTSEAWLLKLLTNVALLEKPYAMAALPPALQLWPC